MKHSYNIRVYYADTDSYGMVWHGTYLRWLEAGRVEFTNHILNMDLKELQEQGCLLPVVELNVKYKRSARLDDRLVLETEIDELRKSSIKFKQTLKNQETGDIYIVAEVTCVAYDTNTNKLMRHLPEKISEVHYN